MEPWMIYLIAGIFVFLITAVRYNVKHRRKEIERQARRRAEAEARQEAERKRQRQMGEVVKMKTGASVSNAAIRVPLPEAHEPAFSGTPAPRQIAKWETEIHQIGRQMIGQLDTKMVALQTLTQEANRVANRLEILVDHLENLARSQISPVPAERQVFHHSAFTENTDNAAGNPSESPAPETSHLFSSERLEDKQVEYFADLLDDLESEVDQLERETNSSVPGSTEATILKMEQVEDADRVAPPKTKEISNHLNKQPASVPSQEPTIPQRLPASIALSTSSPILDHSRETSTDPWTDPRPRFVGQSTNVSARNPLSHSPPRIPGAPVTATSIQAPLAQSTPTASVVSSPAHRITISSPSQTPPASSQSAQTSEHLGFDSLFDDDLARREGEPVFAVAGVESSATTPAASVASPPPSLNPATGTRLELRKQVEILADYGHSPRQIAQSLNITIGEVDLILSLRQS